MIDEKGERDCGSDYPLGTWERVTLLLLLTISVSTLSLLADVFWYLPRFAISTKHVGFLAPRHCEAPFWLIGEPYSTLWDVS